MFYQFSQKNTGGRFIFSDTITRFVVIEADSSADANDIAEEIGIYFDGCDSGVDCPCCGDRWYALWGEEKGDTEPMIYGRPVADAHKRWRDTQQFTEQKSRKDGPEIYVYRAKQAKPEGYWMPGDEETKEVYKSKRVSSSEYQQEGSQR